MAAPSVQSQTGVLTDLSEAALAAAIEANTVEYWRTCCTYVPGAKFYDGLESMKLWASPVASDTPRSQSPEDRRKIDRGINCILCALCYGSCPINAEKPEYLGPAALAKAWRFHEDSRMEDKERFKEAALVENGSPMCDLIMNCVRVCPKGVAPGGTIRKIKNLEQNLKTHDVKLMITYSHLKS